MPGWRTVIQHGTEAFMVKSKVLRKSIMSYLAVLLIPATLLGLMIVTDFSKRLRKEVIHSTTSMLTQASEILDSRFSDLSRISYQISANRNLQPFLSPADGNEMENYPSVYNGIQELEDYKISNGMIENIYLALREKDVVLSDKGKYSYNTFEKYICVWQDSPQGSFTDRINSIASLTVIPSRPAYVNGTRTNLISYVQPLPVQADYQYTATLAVTIREDSVRQILHEVLGEYSGYVYILDSKNRGIFTCGLNNSRDYRKAADKAVHKSMAFIQDQDGDLQNGITNFEQGKFILSYIQSDIMGWKYVAAMPARQIQLKMRDYQKIFIFVMFMALIIGGWAAFKFSRRNYRNIRNITDTLLSGQNMEGQETISNEWNFINDAAVRVIRENASLRDKLEKHMPIIRNDFFRKLLTGEMQDGKSIAAMANFLSVQLNFNACGVLLTSIDSYEEIEDAVGEPERNVIHLSLAARAEEIGSALGRGYAVRLGKDKDAVLVAFDNKDPDADRKALKSAAHQLRACLYSDFGISITAAISDIQGEVSRIRTAYQQAEYALSYRLIDGKSTVISYAELYNCESRVAGCYYTFDQERQLMQFLRVGDFDSIRKMLGAIVEQIKTRPVPIEVVRCTYFDIINTTRKALDELGITDFGYEEHFAGLMRGKSLTEVYEEACSFYFNTCERIRDARNQKDCDFKQRIVEYIGHHSMDNEISVENVAGHFHVSGSYISKLVKERTGSGFTDYVNKQRLAKAKHLLCETEMLVSDIAGATGYNSVYNFTRVFKRYEKMTPTQYRLSGSISQKCGRDHPAGTSIS